MRTNLHILAYRLLLILVLLPFITPKTNATQSISFYTEKNRRKALRESSEEFLIPEIENIIVDFAGFRFSELQRILWQEGYHTIKKGESRLQQGSDKVKQGGNVIGKGNQIKQRGKKLWEMGNRIWEQGHIQIPKNNHRINRGKMMKNRGKRLMSKGKKLKQKGEQIWHKGDDIWKEGFNTQKKGKSITQQAAKIWLLAENDKDLSKETYEMMMEAYPKYANSTVKKGV